jgi:hypothetical protein
MEQNSKSPHILNTSANLFGLCFAVFTYLKVLHLSASTLIDEFTAVAMLLFMISCTTSFLSIRSKSKRSVLYERIADYVFMAGMALLLLTTIFIVFRVMA